MAQMQEKVRTETIIPYFKLPSNRGKFITPWDYKQRKHLLIYFFGGAACAVCEVTLQAFADNYYEYRRLNTEVLAIGIDTLEALSAIAERLQLPYPILADEGGEVANKYTYLKPGTQRPMPSIFVADRYGSLEEEWIAQEENDLPQQRELLSLLQLFELRCPE